MVFVEVDKDKSVALLNALPYSSSTLVKEHDALVNYQDDTATVMWFPNPITRSMVCAVESGHMTTIESRSAIISKGYSVAIESNVKPSIVSFA